MSALEDRPTLGERYGIATKSSDLRVTDERGDADLLIAAGWLDDDLGALLFRLAHEFDAVKAEIGVGHAEFDRVERVACALDAEAAATRRRVGEEDRPAWDYYERQAKGRADEAADIRDRATRQAISTHSLILMRLKTWRATREALVVFARPHAARFGLALPELVLKGVVMQALDIHLDRMCRQCQGRGFNGGFGAPQIICKGCGGRTKRDSGAIGRDQSAHDFGEFLLKSMAHMLGRAGAGIGRALRGDETPDVAGRAEAGRQLSSRLDALRGLAATTD